MKLFKRKGPSSYGTFSLGRGAVFYVPVLLFAVVFTQALRSPVSVVLLWFVCTLPIVSFFYALIGRANVGAFVLSDETTAEKLTPVGYEFRVSNYSILPLPFTEAEIFLPTENGVSCESRLIRMSILPRGEYYFKSSVVFRYRGSYRVGVGCIYVSDMLRIFRLRRFVNIYSKIYVMPRRILFAREDDQSPSDTPTDSRVTDGNESSETNLIREYRGGDPLKHIHWKLSSKMQDLQVNDYKPNSGKNVYIFCDFATLFPEDENGKRNRRRPFDRMRAKDVKKPRVIPVKLPGPGDSQMTTVEKMEAMSNAASDRAAAAAATAEGRRAVTGTAESAEVRTEPASSAISAVTDDYERLLEHANDIKPNELLDFDEYCADGVSEIAVGVVMNELGRGNNVTLMWFDERADNGFFCYSVRSYDDIDSFFKHFGTAPFCSHDMKVTLLSSLIDDTDGPTFVYVTAAAGLGNAGDYINASRSAGAERSEVLLFDPREKFKNEKLRGEYIDICRLRYAENKITLTSVKPSWETESVS